MTAIIWRMWSRIRDFICHCIHSWFVIRNKSHHLIPFLWIIPPIFSASHIIVELCMTSRKIRTVSRVSLIWAAIHYESSDKSVIPPKLSSSRLCSPTTIEGQVLFEKICPLLSTLCKICFWTVCLEKGLTFLFIELECVYVRYDGSSQYISQ